LEVAALAGTFVEGLPGSNRSEPETLPSAPTKLILTERSWSTVGARASSRSNRRERFLVVIFLSPRQCHRRIDEASVIGLFSRRKLSV
jgi:hypothetical protein